jgi:uncharacterized protein
MKFEIFRDKKGQFRFRCVADNGEIVMSSEAYTEKGNAKKRVDALNTLFKEALPIIEVE